MLWIKNQSSWIKNQTSWIKNHEFGIKNKEHGLIWDQTKKVPKQSKNKGLPDSCFMFWILTLWVNIGLANVSESNSSNLNICTSVMRVYVCASPRALVLRRTNATWAKRVRSVWVACPPIVHAPNARYPIQWPAGHIISRSKYSPTDACSVMSASAAVRIDDIVAAVDPE